MLDELKKIAPNIPDEVIKIWLLPFAEGVGLPTKDNEWDKKKTGEKIKFWDDAKWEKIKIDLSKIDYSKTYFDAMKGLHEAYVQGIHNDYSKLLGEDGKKRFWSAFVYIIKNGKFPQPPIMATDEIGKYQLLDGNHRFFAFIRVEDVYLTYEQLSVSEKENFLEHIKMSAFNRPDICQEVWVCTPKWENSKEAQLRNFLRPDYPDFLQ
ncbi:MAG: hypothetical protein WA051_02130 [Minisyncoccia bacterium]